MASNFAENYIDVAERLQVFKTQFPEGSLQFEFQGQMEIAGATFIYGKAIAYRSPTDPAPGMGWAWEIVPGRTPYTKGSELMVLETSAWGRSMAALGIETKRGIATKQEVTAAKNRITRSSQPDPHDPWHAPLSPIEGKISEEDPSLVSEALEAVKEALNAQEMPAKPIPSRDLQKPAGWGNKPASGKQLGYLKSLIRKVSTPLGVDPSDQNVVDVVSAFRGEDLKDIAQISAVSASEVIDDLVKGTHGNRANKIIEDLSSLWRDQADVAYGIPRDHAPAEMDAAW